MKKFKKIAAGIMAVCASAVMTSSVSAETTLEWMEDNYDELVEMNGRENVDFFVEAYRKSADKFRPWAYDIMSDRVAVVPQGVSGDEFDWDSYPDNTVFIRDDMVIVVFKHEYSELNKKWDAGELGCDNIKSVEDLTFLDFTREEKNNYLASVTFRQMLRIDLIETGKEKIAEIMKILSERKDIKCVEPDVIIRPEKDTPDTVTYMSDGEEPENNGVAVDEYGNENWLGVTLKYWKGESFKDYTVGDVDFDGSINLQDAVLAAKGLAGTAKLSYIQKKAADVNNNNECDLHDVIEIAKSLL